ncbi:conserved hypothetical protein [Methanolacinia petrolearia DSM 11571]|uniref:Archaeal Type IV pilin N-terminal domain-containing protein n=1 Tax=Methanolacinia petrolearia (strain DSM 11571 / OCM 486 / SEBR 4847) TaxID=679926 RepID=E1RI18_METP4|nr:type IV pilin N-terminal domain-containing protein [Methanolacinia petrolearia]ADN35403.1 conserved hypothetical protein [Methanolacinia petrolearia DSM 11571]
MRYEKRKDCAVSPVVGVMLMLVVTIIIAAVVSAFAGGITSGEKVAPQISADMRIINTGDPDSSFDIYVYSVSEPIPSSDIKIMTSWIAESATNTGTFVRGGSTTTAGVSYLNYYYAGNDDSPIYRSFPYGYGAGVEDWGAYGNPTDEMQFGNYTITGGTTMHIGAYGPRTYGSGTGGYEDWVYTYVSDKYFRDDCIDGMQVLLGDGWEVLRTGDSVNVKLIHIPSGKTILSKDISVLSRV